VRESRHEPALLMFDGGVASVVSAWLELSAAESDEHARLAGSAKSSGKRDSGGSKDGHQRPVGAVSGRDGEGGGRAESVSLVPAASPRLWVMTCGDDGVALSSGLISARSRVAGLLAELGPMDAPIAEVGLGREVGARHALVNRLVEAAFTAVELGLRRVVWPVQFGGVDGVAADGVREMGGASSGASGGLDVDLDLVSDAWDKAVLVSRVASLDTPGVQIETPFLDLRDSELLELGVDLGAPVEASWVCRDESAAGVGEPCGVCAGCLRWLATVRGEGVVSVKTRGVDVDSIRPRRAGSSG